MDLGHILSDDTAQVFLNEDLVDATLLKVADGSLVFYSSRCPGRTTPNQDAALLFPCGGRKCVFAVADGAGGARSGHEASAQAILALKTAIAERLKAGGEIRTGMLNGFEEANRVVLELGVGAGTTLAAVEVNDVVVRPYHVGDSLIIAVGQRGKVKLQTIAHSPVGYGIESGFIGKKEAMFHEDRHLVSNLVGSSEMRIDIGPTIELSKLDTLLIASDGLSDNLHIDEIISIIRKGSLLTAAHTMARKCAGRMQSHSDSTPSKPDDLTFVLFRLAA